MDLREEKSGDVLVVSVSDRLDSVTSPEFERRILSFIERGDSRILLDFEKLDYMNSAGLKAILLAAKKLAPLKGKLVLTGLASNVYSVFEITGFHKLFTIRDDRTQGMEAF